MMNLRSPVQSKFFASEGYLVNVPIIAVSAMFDVQFASTRLHAPGIRDCLAKPFDLDTLPSLVAKLA
jgi:FixJ family two-component response regulator